MQSNVEQSSESCSPQPQRLPVNPRRHKVAPEQRKRVVRACNACNVRRVRCSGEQPCQRCSVASRECEYTVPETDKNALKNENERLRQRCAALEKGFQAAAPVEAAELIRQLNDGRPLTRLTVPTFHSILSETDEPEATEGRLLSDCDGTVRYLGETSGATFLDYLKDFMLALVPLTFQPGSEDGSLFVASVGRYQTFDSRPLPNPNVDPLWLPSRTDMTLMLVELGYAVQDGNGDFPSGGTFWWGDLSKVPTPVPSLLSLNTMTTDDTFRYLAFYHVSFAIVSSVGHSSFRHSDQHTGEAYFKRARMLLGNPLDTVRFTLSDVPVLALMGFYLIELNRRDAAYMYVSLAIHIATIHGAFRSCVDEASKRTFWTLYILDRWLSVLMGRPPTIMDEAIRLPLPMDAPSMPPSAGLRASVELARISGYIVHEIFKVAPQKYSPGYSTRKVSKALKMLTDWQLHLPPLLAIHPEQKTADPTRYTLHMAQNQLILLTTRPVFLAAVKQAVAERFSSGQWSVEQHAHAKHIQACSEAAHRNLLLAQRLKSTRKLLQAGLHHVFNAAVILLLNRIVTSDQGHQVGFFNGNTDCVSSGERLHTSEINTAISIFEKESKTGTNYPRDCCRVLKDLKALVDRYPSHGHGNFWQQKNITEHAYKVPVAQTDTEQSCGSPPSPSVFTAGDDLYREMMAWKQSDGLQLLCNVLA